MTYRQKKQAIINEYHAGASIEYLSKKYYIKEHIIEKTLALINSIPLDQNTFNVDLLDCWIVPTRNSCS